MGKLRKLLGLQSSKKGGGGPSRPAPPAPDNSVVQEQLRSAPKRPSRPAPMGANVSGEGGDVDLLGLRADHAGEGSESSSEEQAPVIAPPMPSPYAPMQLGGDSSSESSESSSEESSSEEEMIAPPVPAPSPYKPMELGGDSSSESSSEESSSEEDVVVAPPVQALPDEEVKKVYGINLGSDSSSESSSEESSSEDEMMAAPPVQALPEEEVKKVYGISLGSDSSEESSSEEESSSSESSSSEEEEMAAPIAPPKAPEPKRSRYADRWGENSDLARLKGAPVPAPARGPAPEPDRKYTPGVSRLPVRKGEGRYARSGKLDNGRTHWEAAGVEGGSRPEAWTGLVPGHGYENEQVEAKHVPGQVSKGKHARTHYNTREERADTQLTGHRGRLVPSADQNLPADTRDFDSKLSAGGGAKGKANFAVADGGGLYGMNPQWGETETAQEVVVSHHSSLLAGEDVVTAGEISAEHGRVKEVTNSSGHYRPDDGTILPGLEAMEEQGIDLSMAQVKPAGGGERGRAGPYLEAQVGAFVPSAPYSNQKGAPRPETDWARSSLAPRAAMHDELAQKVAPRAAAAEGGAQAVSGKVDTKDAQAAAEQRLAAAQTPEEREDAAFHLTDVLEQRDWEKRQKP